MESCNICQIHIALTCTSPDVDIWDQSDQIGTNFRQLGDCLLMYLGHFTEHLKSCKILWSYELFSTQNGMGYILGDFLQTHLVNLTGIFILSKNQILGWD
jgi:hypothetical protein